MLSKTISTLHFITQEKVAELSHVALAEKACKAGVKWVQLRLKNETDAEKRSIALEVKKICANYGATFILNDHVYLAKEVDADGVHLGKTDMPIPEARAILGETKIFGGTANDAEDIQKLIAWKADYIGLGPLRFTDTKQNLSPILGFDGYKNLLNSTGVTIPIIAIGGINTQDIAKLHEIGIYGVAIASGISTAENPSEIVNAFHKGFKK